MGMKWLLLVVISLVLQACQNPSRIQAAPHWPVSVTE
jgi:hypothetical protein